MTVHGYEILSPRWLQHCFFPLGACDCDTGYTGDDCSVAETDPPELDSIEGGALIDISVGVVRQLVVYGADFVDSDKLTCHYFLSNVWGCFLCHELWDKIIQVPLNIENVKIQDLLCSIRIKRPWLNIIHESSIKRNKAAGLGLISFLFLIWSFLSMWTKGKKDVLILDLM